MKKQFTEWAKTGENFPIGEFVINGNKYISYIKEFEMFNESTGHMTQFKKIYLKNVDKDFDNFILIDKSKRSDYKNNNTELKRFEMLIETGMIDDTTK